mmetsp:Transcript_11442/g.14911  ORF Transcript_11442/g.14911 Transcript_11442/m.14911 type:complete len:110 (+) Transcript_11442:531-860(+)
MALRFGRVPIQRKFQITVSKNITKGITFRKNLALHLSLSFANGNALARYRVYFLPNILDVTHNIIIAEDTRKVNKVSTPRSAWSGSTSRYMENEAQNMQYPRNGSARDI